MTRKMEPIDPTSASSTGDSIESQQASGSAYVSQVERYKSDPSQREFILAISEGSKTHPARQRPARSITQYAKTWLDESNIQNDVQVEKAKNTLLLIDNVLKDYPDLTLPEFQVSQAEDGTIGFAWNVGDATLGISIDPIPSESRWFLLIGEQNEAVTAYGKLNKINENVLLSWIVSLIESIR